MSGYHGILQQDLVTRLAMGNELVTVKTALYEGTE